MASRRSLKLTLRTTNEMVEAQLQGPIDEYCGPEIFRLSEVPTQQLLRINFSGVTSVNSTGIRNWLTAIKSLHKHSQLEYVECPQCVFESLNMVPDLRPDQCVVGSVLATLRCRCGASQSIKIDRQQWAQAGIGDQSSTQCPKCAKPMNLDTPKEDLDSAFSGEY